MGKRRVVAIAVTVASVAAAAGMTTMATGIVSGDGTRPLRARVQDVTGTQVGMVRFGVSDRGSTTVRVNLQFDPTRVATDVFHGFHVHANDDPANGTGCVADPASLPPTWFTSADLHWKLAGQDHGAHLGDLFSVYVAADGSATGRFETRRFGLTELAGKAVILHVGPDNFGNVPTGSAANQYLPNAVDATTLTANTGNAGVRIACGVVGS